MAVAPASLFPAGLQWRWHAPGVLRRCGRNPPLRARLMAWRSPDCRRSRSIPHRAAACWAGQGRAALQAIAAGGQLPAQHEPSPRDPRPSGHRCAWALRQRRLATRAPGGECRTRRPVAHPGYAAAPNPESVAPLGQTPWLRLQLR